MNQNYSINYFTPSESTIAVIKQYAYVFRTLKVDGKYVPFCLN